jgi:hypothetical protein
MTIQEHLLSLGFIENTHYFIDGEHVCLIRQEDGSYADIKPYGEIMAEITPPVVEEPVIENQPE